jgi:hypothetical protein
MRGTIQWLGSALLLSGLWLARPASAEAPAREGEIVMEMHHDRQFEVGLGMRAEHGATSAALRDFGARMVRDQSALDQRVVAYGQAIAIDPDKLAHPYDAEPHGVLKWPDLSRVARVEFDRDLTQDMVAELQAAIDRAVSAQLMTGDVQLKTMIGQMLPTLRAQLTEAQALVPPPAPPK